MILTLKNSFSFLTEDMDHIELIMALLKNGSKFIIRLDSRTINKERQKMESDGRIC